MSPELAAVVTIAAMAFAGPGVVAMMGGGWGGALASGAILGAGSGGLSAGLQGQNVGQGMLHGAAQGVVTAGVFYAAGNVAGYMEVPNGSVSTMLVHGVAGGTANAVLGGSFKNGFISAAVADGADNLPIGNTSLQFLAHAGAGAAASWLTGGDTTQGAINGAAGYLFNYLSHSQRDQRAVDLASCKGDQGCTQAKEAQWNKTSSDQNLAMTNGLINQGVLPQGLADQLRSTDPSSPSYISLLSQAVSYGTNSTMDYLLVNQLDGVPTMKPVFQDKVASYSGPDYAYLSGSGFGLAGGVGVNLRNGQFYALPGASVPVTKGAQFMVGWLPRNGDPEKQAIITDQFLNGAGVSASGCYVVCYGINHSYGGGTAIETGLGYGTNASGSGGTGIGIPVTLPGDRK